jgi:surfactin family lipopeptide synthetase A/bacitracin synthase 1/bacitracin synthase 2/bacitracin synthase 3
VSIYEVKSIEAGDKYIPIGKALSNLKFYLFDDQLEPVKPGTSGELYVGGIGVAKGYVNNKELTEKFFIRNPHNSSEYLYKTGDLVKELPDGNIVILGRKDTQVKILGHRIELSAIESEIILMDSVTNALVLAKENTKGEKYLVVYFTATTNSSCRNKKEATGKTSCIYDPAIYYSG